MEITSTDRRPYALIADDDATIRMVAAGILEDAGFRTREAEHGEDALALLREHHASIILLFTDVEMSGLLDGFALARETARCWPHIGILVASGRRTPDPDDMPEGAHFVAKPFSADVVYDHLKQLLPDDQKPEPLRD